MKRLTFSRRRQVLLLLLLLKRKVGGGADGNKYELGNGIDLVHVAQMTAGDSDGPANGINGKRSKSSAGSTFENKQIATVPQRTARFTHLMWAKNCLPALVQEELHMCIGYSNVGKKMFSLHGSSYNKEFIRVYQHRRQATSPKLSLLKCVCSERAAAANINS